MSITIDAPIRLDDGHADSTLRWAEIAGKKVFILTQTGAYADICYDHGALLGAEIETGVFPEIIDTIRTETHGDDSFAGRIPAAIYRRISDEVFAACSDEFRAGVDALGMGMFDTLDDPAFSAMDVRDAMVAIDAGNCAEGLARRMQKPLAADVSETIAYVIGAARRYRRGRSRLAMRKRIQSEVATIGRDVQRFGTMRGRTGFGCTAAGVAPAESDDGRGLHARTFDGAFFAWNTWPGVFLVDERQTNPAWHRYVAVGTAGLSYSGGISGLNDQGVAASIHQMSTARYDTGRPGRGYALAPFLMQRILREAATIDQAEAILRGAKHFGSWTIVVSDAKAGAAARFEMNGGTQTVARTDLGTRFGQSNHFQARDMAETHDFFGDKHFTPTFGKWLESRARLETVDRAFAAAVGTGFGTDQALALLAGHNDGLLNGALRSFGRTVCRAYGIMGTVARTDPDRDRAADEIWFCTGSAAPGMHGDVAGLAIDWEAMTLNPVAERPVRQPCTLSSDMQAAIADYVAAFRTVTRPTDADGEYLGRDPTPQEEDALRDTARTLLDRATRRADNAGEIDVALHYARARLAHDAGDFAAAEQDWAFLRDLTASGGVPVHDYEQALILILSAATALQRGAGDAATDYLDQGSALLAALRTKHFGDGPAHADLASWNDVVNDLRTKGADATLPDFEFVTVE